MHGIVAAVHVDPQELQAPQSQAHQKPPAAETPDAESPSIELKAPMQWGSSRKRSQLLIHQKQPEWGLDQCKGRCYKNQAESTWTPWKVPAPVGHSTFNWTTKALERWVQKIIQVMVCIYIYIYIYIYTYLYTMLFQNINIQTIQICIATRFHYKFPQLHPLPGVTRSSQHTVDLCLDKVVRPANIRFFPPQRFSVEASVIIISSESLWNLTLAYSTKSKMIG